MLYIRSGLPPEYQSDILRWMRNHLTFTLCHFTAFAVSVGVFAAGFRPTVIRTLSPRTRRNALITLGLVLAGFTVGTTLDALTNPIEPYELRGAALERAICLERWLRGIEVNPRPECAADIPDESAFAAAGLTVEERRKRVGEAAEEAYNRLVKPRLTGPPANYWSTLNAVALANYTVTLSIALYCGLLFWYGWVLYAVRPAIKFGEATRALRVWSRLDSPPEYLRSDRAERREGVTDSTEKGYFMIASWLDYAERPGMEYGEFKVIHEKVLLSFVLLLAWFPLRIYTTWYQNVYWHGGGLDKYPAFWVMALLAVIFAALLVYLAFFRDPVSPGTRAVCLALVLPILLFVPVAFSTQYAAGLFELVSQYVTQNFATFFVSFAVLAAAIWASVFSLDDLGGSRLRALPSREPTLDDRPLVDCLIKGFDGDFALCQAEFMGISLTIEIQKDILRAYGIGTRFQLRLPDEGSPQAKDVIPPFPAL